MPILKNITSKNMIPIIDFEDFNENFRGDDQKMDNIELKYIFINLFEIIPRLSETTASTLLLRFPCFINEEITFHSFPSKNCLEVGEMRRLINPEMGEAFQN